jgi:uncharacterized protein YjbI with pentapeptide repeats
MKSIIDKELWTGEIENKEFSSIQFNELNIRDAKIQNCQFKNVEFKNCYLGFNSQYNNCSFENCKIHGKYSSLGNEASYNSCRFVNFTFIGLDIFTGQQFKDCKFSGKIQNAILIDKYPSEKRETFFERCDLTNLQFEHVNIYGRNIFRDCLLPTFGLRYFDNKNNILLNRIKTIENTFDRETLISVNALFRQEIYSLRDKIILDNPTIESILNNDDSRRLFEQLVNEFEIK